MSEDVISISSSRTLALSGCGLIYLYCVLSWRCLLAGLPILSGLLLHWTLDHQLAGDYPRVFGVGLLLLNLSYWISSSSYILYPVFLASAWLAIVVISLCRYQICYRHLAPIRQFLVGKVAALEDLVHGLHWPIVDFDGQGILALTESMLVLRQMTFNMSGIDFTLQVDEHTKIIARIEGLRVRLARDITINEIYVKFEGDGTPASAFKSFNPPVRPVPVKTLTNSSTEHVNVGEKSPSRKLPPISPLAATRDGSNGRPNNLMTAVTPPRLPPRLPARGTPVERSNHQHSVTAEEEDTEEEKQQLQQAIEASIIHEKAKALEPGREVLDNDRTVGSTTTADLRDKDSLPEVPDLAQSYNAPSRNDTTTSIGQHSTTSYFYPAEDDTSTAELKAAFDEAAFHHSSNTDNPEHNEFDMKAAIAASLKDQADLHKQKSREKRIQLSAILAKIPWWLKVTPGPLMTRLLLSPLLWLHPIKISSVAATSSGKRITNLMETSGLKKSHPNQEIFNLIRKVFVWLEAGDISVVLNDISVRPHIPLAAHHDVRIEVTAHEPTAYRNTNGTDDVLAKINAISATVHIPTFLLPNHAHLIPTTIKSSIPFDILFSLPGVFNRELLTIGAAFIKATTMMDLRQTAQSRAPPPMPSLSGGGQFSFRSLGQAVKQAAGDLAKQKGVQWGVRDAELAKWTAKLARLMAFVKIDVGGKGEIPVDLIRLRRRVLANEKKV